MVQAILDGRKTQTRRVVKIPDGQTAWSANKGMYLSVTDEPENPNCRLLNILPKWSVGDHLWVRETFAEVGCIGWPIDKFEYAYRADFPDGQWSGYADMCLEKWKPSIFMPRAASRITLEVTSVRAERLNDISEADAVSEGIAVLGGKVDDSPVFENYLKRGVENGYGYPKNSFRSLWQSINGTDSWQANPFVWVISFKKVGP